MLSKSVFSRNVAIWPNLDHGGVAIRYCDNMYTLKVICGDVIINEQTLRESAINKIKMQPFFRIKCSVLASYYL